jgi:ketosteroid isomerase-like protein
MTDIQYVLDRIAIQDIQIAYARALDAKAFDRLADVFLPDGVADYEGIGVCNGVDSIKGVCSGALTPLDQSQHLLGNHWAEIDGDAATAGCYFQAQHHVEGADGGPNFIVAGVYTDQLVRTDAGWRIKHRTLTIWWTDGNDGVLAPPAPE